MSFRLKTFLPALFICTQSLVALAENAYLNVWESWSESRRNASSVNHDVMHTVPRSSYAWTGTHFTPNGHRWSVVGVSLGPNIGECARAYTNANFSGYEIPIAAEDNYNPHSAPLRS